MNQNLAGLGFRAPFYEDLIAGHPDVGWLEIITENYLWDEGGRRETLHKLRAHYELSFHGVSLSLAAPEDLDQAYLNRMKDFCREFQPARVSDHLCWSSLKGHHWHDLLPFPYTEENLARIAAKVSRWQDFMGRPLLLENLSAYAACKGSEMGEYEFLDRLCDKTQCGLLLDVNNMIVNARNFGWDAWQALDQLDLSKVGQIHLAGHVKGEDFSVDTHSTAPDQDTLKLFAEVGRRRAGIPYMIEWDDDIPDTSVVLAELAKAKKVLA